MRFVDRENEIANLKEIKELSRRKLFVAVIYGLRRVGKTRLLIEFIKNNGVYFFVNKNKTSQDLLNEFQVILKENGILGELEKLPSWDKFFEVLVNRKPITSVFDEFQNFAFVNPAIFGTLQKTIDLNENKSGMIILSGSLIGLMKDLFKNNKEPLYGRIKFSKKLEPLNLTSCIEIGKELGFDTELLLKLYMIFGGYPKYYVTMEDYKAKGNDMGEILDLLVLNKNAPLEDEVNTVLSQEFGNRSGLYYSLLEAIATGNNTISAIAGYLNVPATSITRQLGELKDYFELIELEMPYNGKRGMYKIIHPFLYFWFSQIYKNQSDYASRNPEFMKAVRLNLNVFFGRRFETVARELLTARLGLTESHRQWGKIPMAKGEETTYEIDLIGKNEKHSYIFEVKWKNLDDKAAIKIIEKLREKAGYVKELPSDHKFGIVAKKLTNKDKVLEAGYLAYDLSDL
jgi:AAA+ ATPase superfamily predicted ATPase